MNMNLKLNFNPKTILPALQRARPYLIGILLISVFGYTAYVVNQALNVTAVETASNPPVTITFDKPTIEAIKNLSVVSGQVSPGELGKDDPFGR